MADVDPEVVANLDHHFHRQVHRITAALRDRADRIEKRIQGDVRPSLRDGLPDYLSVICDIEHELRSMMMNLPNDQMLESGMDVHLYVRTGKTR